MNSTIEDKIRENPALSATIAQANKALEERVDRWLLEVSATWSYVQDQNQRQFIELKLADKLSSLSRLFTPEELTNPGQWGSPLYRFWDDFVEVMSRKHLVRLHQLVAELDKE